MQKLPFEIAKYRNLMRISQFEPCISSFQSPLFSLLQKKQNTLFFSCSCKSISTVLFCKAKQKLTLMQGQGVSTCAASPPLILRPPEGRRMSGGASCFLCLVLPTSADALSLQSSGKSLPLLGSFCLRKSKAPLQGESSWKNFLKKTQWKRYFWHKVHKKSAIFCLTVRGEAKRIIKGYSNINRLNTRLFSSKNQEFIRFFNFPFDKSRLKSVVLWFFKNYGQKKTIELLEKLKHTGFGYATKAGISLGIDDLKIPPQKIDLLMQAEKKIQEGQIQYKKGEITGVERFQRLIDTWHETSESLKKEVVHHFETTDLLNPVYMMAFSGARGNLSQVRQLVGMRGLMADPQGQILDFPIRSNFREGLTLTEYIISTYGARKGIVDTALRTANAGYLTRRLVDVAQHVIVSEFDCGTKRGIFVFDMKEGNKTIYSFQNRLIGRVLAQDIQNNNRKIAQRNQEIDSNLSVIISKIKKKALIRSPLTCTTKKLVCQLCYGWSLSNNHLVSIGEAVGIIAAQSIGEPGTQLTMRTFHTGGVFSGGLSDQIIAQYDGVVEYSHTIAGICIRTPRGQIAFLTKTKGTFAFYAKAKALVFQKRNSKMNNFSNEKIHNENHLLATSAPPLILLPSGGRRMRGGQNKPAFSPPPPQRGGEDSVHAKSKHKKNPKLQDVSTALVLKNEWQAEEPAQFFTIPPYTILFARNRQKMVKKNIICQISSISLNKTQRSDAEQTIYSEFEGEIYNSHMDVIEKTNETNDNTFESWGWGYLWILAGKIYKSPIQSYMFARPADFVNRNSVLNRITWMNSQKCLIENPLVLKNQSLFKTSSLLALRKRNEKQEANKISKTIYNFLSHQTHLSFLNNKRIRFRELSNEIQKVLLNSNLIKKFAKHNIQILSKQQFQRNTLKKLLSEMQKQKSLVNSTRLMKFQLNSKKLLSDMQKGNALFAFSPLPIVHLSLLFASRYFLSKPKSEKQKHKHLFYKQRYKDCLFSFYLRPSPKGPKGGASFASAIKQKYSENRKEYFLYKKNNILLIKSFSSGSLNQLYNLKYPFQKQFKKNLYKYSNSQTLNLNNRFKRIRQKNFCIKCKLLHRMQTFAYNAKAKEQKSKRKNAKFCKAVFLKVNNLNKWTLINRIIQKVKIKVLKTRIMNISLKILYKKWPLLLHKMQKLHFHNLTNILKEKSLSKSPFSIKKLMNKKQLAQAKLLPPLGGASIAFAPLILQGG